MYKLKHVKKYDNSGLHNVTISSEFKGDNSNMVNMKATNVTKDSPSGSDIDPF